MAIGKSQSQLIKKGLLKSLGEVDGINVSSNKKLLTATGKIVDGFGVAVETALKQSLDEAKKNASSTLKQSIRYEVQELKDSVRLELFIEDYYIFVNDGRKKGKRPPFKAISDWIRFKGVTNLSYKGLGFKTRQTSRVNDKVKKVQLVEAIRWKIARKGIKPTDFYDNVVNRANIGELMKTLQKSVGKTLVIDLTNIR
jgi:hypothetical protein